MSPDRVALLEHLRASLAVLIDLQADDHRHPVETYPGEREHRARQIDQLRASIAALELELATP